MLYIGIDLGTSSVKAILMDEAGNVRRSVSESYPLFFPKEGWSEQNPEDWDKAVRSCIVQLAGSCDPAEIAGIGVAGQMHGLVALDENDAVIRPAILWNDGRSAEEAEYLNSEIGKEKLSEWTGNIAFAGFTAPKLLWMQKHEPENFRRIRKIMLPKDYIVYMLTGRHCTDMSDASGLLLLDVAHRRWSEEMLNTCGVSREQMPELLESYEVVDCVAPQIADALGLTHHVKVVAGAGDNAAAAVGTGTVGDGSCNISLGTSGTVFIARDTFGVDQSNALHSFAHADGSYHLMGCMLSAASGTKWWIENILKTKNYKEEEGRITEAMLGRNNVFWLPYLMGERSPHNDPNARAAFIGMRMDTSRESMTQAVFEGVAFALRDSLEIAKTLGVSVRMSRLCGGGAKSRLWQTIMASVLNMPIELLAVDEGPGLGAAMLAAVGCGAYVDVKEAAATIVKSKHVVEPDSNLAARYKICYEKYRKLYPALKFFFQ